MINESNYYELFIQSTYDLAETIVIKSEQTASAINLEVSIRNPGRVDEFNKRTWKYYLNLSGEYHFTNQPMYVKSLDNLEEILFNKENLEIHRATKRGYEYGSRYYKELVSNYPDQEMLILGILYPIDIDKAIEAEDFKILGYPDHLVEFNEESLIPNIQYWIDSFNHRWYNPQYTCDDLYDLSHLAKMYLMLPPLIITLRLQACKTREAHSYHVKQYLASHGGLDRYIDQMTTKQALWVYRNILYIEHNSGKQDNFFWLIEHLLTERSIPIAEFTMRHDIENQPDELYATPKFRRLGINPIASGDQTDRISLETILRKEDKLARDNYEYREENYNQINRDFENSKSNVVMTKALESEMYDYSDSSPYSLAEILINHWYWLASNGLYTAVVGVDNPKTGERIVLTAKEAAVFSFYCVIKTSGLEYTCIPPMVANRVQRIPTPTASEIRKVADYNYVSLDDAKLMLSRQPIIEPLISTEAFYNKCVEIFEAMDFQRRFVAYQENQAKRGYMKGMADQIYSDNICYMTDPNETYDQWFADRNIKIEDFSIDELGQINMSIIRQVTGLNLTNTKSVRNLQAAMIAMMKQLSSYSIQYLKEINGTAITMLDWPMIRLGDMDSTLKSSIKVPAINVGAQNLTNKVKQIVEYDASLAAAPDFKSKFMNEIELDLPPIIHLDRDAGFRSTFFIDLVKMANVNIDMTPYQNDEGIFPVPGIDIFLKMTPEERNTLTDFTGRNCFYPRPTFE